MKSTIRLFKALPIDHSLKSPALPSKELLEKTIKRGFIFSPEIVANYHDYDKLINFIEREVGLTPEQLNSSFHKSWEKVKTASMEQLFMEQIIHYITTYGFESMGIYDKDSVYIPNEQLDIPNLVIDDLKLVVIKGYTKEELKEKLMGMLSSGIALKEQTIFDVVELGSFVGLDKQDLEKIKNKEVKITLYDELKIVPENPVEFLRYVIFKITGNTLLIKDPVTIAEIVQYMGGSGTTIGDQLVRNNIVGLFAKLGTSQLRILAGIFYRFKPLFLSLRAEYRLRPTINKIRRLARVYHQPMPEDYLNTVTAKLKKGEGLDTYQINAELDRVNVFRKVRLAYALKYRTKSPESILYKIRNGKGYATKFDFDNRQGAKEVLDIVLDSITGDIKKNVKGKKIYIPEYITYPLPATEKQFVDKFPSGTCISVPKDMIVGVHWKNTKYRVDLDFSLISHEYGKVGWDSLYRTQDSNILFSGDITDAPRGATELFYVTKQCEQSSIMVINYFNHQDNEDNTEVPFKIIVASDEVGKLDRHYVINPNKVITLAESSIVKGQKVIGLLVTTDHESKFYFTEANLGLSITSSGKEYIVDSRNYLFDFNTGMITLNDVLEKAGAKVINQWNTVRADEIDIDLSPENLEKDSILNLMKE